MTKPQSISEDQLDLMHIIEKDTHTISPKTIDLFQKFIKKNI